MLNSEAVSRIYSKQGTYLLPMVTPLGCPGFSSYAQAHGVILGAVVTVMKAFFDESFVIPNP